MLTRIMRVIPKTAVGQIDFVNSHLPAWSAEPGAIGLSPAEIVRLQERLDAARDLQLAAAQARDAARAATLAFNEAAERLREDAARAVAKIKAAAMGDENVYAAAMIPVPAAGAPAQPPGPPADIAVTLEPDGSVTLSWTAADAAASTGAFFRVSRRLPGQSTFVGVGAAAGATGESRRATFTDTAIPSSAAAGGVQYIIQGFRGGRAGEASSAVTVQFGTAEAAAAGARVRLAA
ncbi:hypothetical protein PHYC_02320 [Phycisphaerales bacterium]|nr:hypothetical protein PHYC_02320 [Phycisphaerales bacterium]